MKPARRMAATQPRFTLIAPLVDVFSHSVGRCSPPAAVHTEPVVLATRTNRRCRLPAPRTSRCGSATPACPTRSERFACRAFAPPRAVSKAQVPRPRQVQEHETSSRTLSALFDHLRHHRPRERRTDHQGRGQSERSQFARSPLRARPGGTESPVPSRATALSAPPRGQTRRGEVEAYHLGRSSRRTRDAASQSARRRKARGVCVSPGAQSEQGRGEFVSSRVRNEHSAQPPRTLLGCTPGRNADVYF